MARHLFLLFPLAATLMGCGEDGRSPAAPPSPANATTPSAPPPQSPDPAATLSDGRPIPGDVATFLRDVATCRRVQTAQELGIEACLDVVAAQDARLRARYAGDPAVLALLSNPPLELVARLSGPGGPASAPPSIPATLNDGRPVPLGIAAYLRERDYCTLMRAKAQRHPGYFNDRDACGAIARRTADLRRAHAGDPAALALLAP